jgi:hypothetical protein
MMLPENERIMPRISKTGCFSLKKRDENIPTKIGFVVTRTTLLATEVNFRELIQKKKWSERKRPPSIPARSCFLVKERNPIPLLFAMITRMMEEMVSRYVAIVREGTSSQNFIKMEAKDMAITPTPRPARSLSKGRLPLYLKICSCFGKGHGKEYNEGAHILSGCQKFSPQPVAEKERRDGFHDEND